MGNGLSRCECCRSNYEIDDGDGGGGKTRRVGHVIDDDNNTTHTAPAHSRTILLPGTSHNSDAAAAPNSAASGRAGGANSAVVGSSKRPPAGVAAAKFAAAANAHRPAGGAGSGAGSRKKFLGIDLRKLKHMATHAPQVMLAAVTHEKYEKYDDDDAEEDEELGYNPYRIKFIPPAAPARPPKRKGPELPQKPCITIIGDSHTGKSTFIYTAAVGRYPPDFGQSLNHKTADPVTCTIGLVQLVDTVNANPTPNAAAAGTLSNRSSAANPFALADPITTGDDHRLSCYGTEKCRAIIVCCSLADPASLQSVLTRWAPEVLTRFAPPPPPVATSSGSASQRDHKSSNASGGGPAPARSNTSFLSASGLNSSAAATAAAATAANARWRPPILVLATHADQYRKPKSTLAAAASSSPLLPASSDPFNASGGQSSGTHTPTGASSAVAAAMHLIGNADGIDAAVGGAPVASDPFTNPAVVSSSLGLGKDDDDDADSGSDESASPKNAVLPLTLSGAVAAASATAAPTTIAEAPVLAPTFADSVPTSDFLLDAAGQEWAGKVTALFSSYRYTDQLTYAEVDSHDCQQVRTIIDSIIHNSEIRAPDIEDDEPTPSPASGAATAAAQTDEKSVSPSSQTAVSVSRTSRSATPNDLP